VVLYIRYYFLFYIFMLAPDDVFLFRKKPKNATVQTINVLSEKNMFK